MKEIKVDMGTFPPPFLMPFPNLFAVGIGRMKNIMEDEKLGAFESHCSIYIDNNFLNSPSGKDSPVAGRT